MMTKCSVGGACLLLLLFATAARADTQTVQTSLDDAPPLAAVSIRATAAAGSMRMRANPGKVDINSASLVDLIRNAYGEPDPDPYVPHLWRHVMDAG